MRPDPVVTPRVSMRALCVAALALMAQILLGMAMPAPAGQLSPDVFGSTPICHAGHADDQGDGAPLAPAHRGDHCALCPACHVLASALPVPPSPHAALPRVAAARPVPMPPARAPPGAPVLAATYPTGPPSLA